MKKIAVLAALASAVCFAGCEAPPEQEPEKTGIPALGNGSHSMDDVELTEIATQSDGLNGPRDLGFNPEFGETELWVVSQRDDSTLTIFDPGTEEQEFLKLIDPFALHFMEEVSSIAFAPGMKFGTCQESNNTYNGQAAANNFMGPSLWSADFDIYARTNPAAVDFLGFDLGSHLDMLHESPFCMGMAWSHDNVYWTFDGLTNSISRYDFAEDHGAGFDDHSDGIVDRHIEVEVSRVPGVMSGMVMDHDEQQLYVADTGNSRILKVDPNTGAPSFPIFALEPGVTLQAFVGTHFEELGGEALADLVGMDKPSGLALRDGLLYVADNGTSVIHAFDTATGKEVDYLETGLPTGSLMGMRVDTEGNIWVTDFVGNRVLKIAAK
jgi:hypothetical protein